MYMCIYIYICIHTYVYTAMKHVSGGRGAYALKC